MKSEIEYALSEIKNEFTDESPIHNKEIISYEEIGFTSTDRSSDMLAKASRYFKFSKDDICIFWQTSTAEARFIGGYNKLVAEGFMEARSNGLLTMFQKSKEDKYWTIKLEDKTLVRDSESIYDLIDTWINAYSVTLYADPSTSEVTVIHKEKPTLQYADVLLLGEPISFDLQRIKDSLSSHYDIKYLYLLGLTDDKELVFTNIDKIDNQGSSTIHPTIVMRVNQVSSRPKFIVYSSVLNKVVSESWAQSTASKMMVRHAVEKLESMGCTSYFETQVNDSSQVKFARFGEGQIRQCFETLSALCSEIQVTDDIELLIEGVHIIGKNQGEIHNDPLGYVYKASNGEQITSVRRHLNLPATDVLRVPVVLGQNALVNIIERGDIQSILIHEISHILVNMHFNGKSWFSSTDKHSPESLHKIPLLSSQRESHGDLFLKVLSILESRLLSYQDLALMTEDDLLKVGS